MNYSLSNMLGRFRAGGGPVISGTAFPGETLTSTKAEQWYADGNAISGQTGSTYVVSLSDIGKAITQTGSNTLTIWHPNTIAGVARFWSSLSNVLTSVSPDVPAANADPVRRWNELISGTNADQITSISRPIYRATGQSENPSLEFDGNDFLSLPSNTDVLQNKSQAYIIAGVRDTAPSGGAAIHTVIYYSNDTTFPRLALYTRVGSDFAAAARRQNGDSTAVAVSANNNSYNVLAAHGDFSNGFCRLRVNGSVVASTALSGGSGNTSNTVSQTARIGNAASNEYLSGHETCICVVNAAISATQLSQIERYIGLFGGLNIPLV
jgi:hypothetical protein